MESEEEYITIEEFIHEIVSDFTGEDNLFVNDYAFYKLLKEFEALVWPTIDNFYNYYDLVSFDKMSLQDAFKSINEFYKMLNIDYSVSKARKEAKFIIERHNINSSAKYITQNTLGEVFKEDGNTYLHVSNNNLAIDSVILLHELTHLRNEPKMERSILNLVLSEGLSYVFEEVYLDFLEEKAFGNDIFNYRMYRNSVVYQEMLNAMDILKIYIVEKEFGTVSREGYNKLFSDNMYEVILDDVEKIVNIDVAYLYSYVHHAIGYMFGNLLYYRYKLDNNYIDKLNELNYYLKNGATFDSTMELLDINLSNENTFNEFKKSFNYYINELSNSALNSEVLKRERRM